VSTYPPEAIAAARRGVRAYKTFRHLLREGVYHVLPANKDPQQWDAVRQTAFGLTWPGVATESTGRA